MPEAPAAACSRRSSPPARARAGACRRSPSSSRSRTARRRRRWRGSAPQRVSIRCAVGEHDEERDHDQAARQHLGQQQRGAARPSAPACGSATASSRPAPRRPARSPSSRATTSALLRIQVSTGRAPEHLGERARATPCRAAASAAARATARPTTAAGSSPPSSRRETARARNDRGAQREPQPAQALSPLIGTPRAARASTARRTRRAVASISTPIAAAVPKRKLSNASRRRGCRASRSRPPGRRAWPRR